MQHPWARPGGSREPHHSTLDSPEEMYRREFTEPMDTQPQQQNVPKKSKRFRSAFTTGQVNFLEMEFQKFPYIDSTQRKEVANILNLPERAIKVWFQNRRMREKKDLVSNSESDESNRNTIEFLNDEVNIPTLSQPLEPPYSLPEVSVIPSVKHVAHIDLTNFEPNSNEMPDSRKLNYYSDLIAPLPEVSISRIPKSPPGKQPTGSSSQSKYRSSAEFSIDLCKKYKSFGVTEQQQSKTDDISVRSYPATLPRAPPPRIPPPSSFPKVEAQCTPEDLSLNKSNVPKKEAPSPPKQVSPTSPELVPVYMNYAQPYLSAGNMLWKPVNVMPIMSTGLPVNLPTIPPGPLQPSQEQSTVKKKCNCDCHVEAPPAAQLPNTSSTTQAQYVFTALPFPKYPKF